MIKKMLIKLYKKAKKLVVLFKIRNSHKVFCIGRNKTGTTSMVEIFRLLDIPVGKQKKAELLSLKVLEGDYKDFFSYVKYGGVAFQDVPFSLPNTFKILDQEFPNSKFILTIRDNPEVWYNSLVNFHAKIFGNGKIPSKEDLKNATYRYPGWVWELIRLHFNTPEDDIYNKEILIKQYEDHINDVLEYFKDQHQKLLVINLKEPNATDKITRFLNSNKTLNNIPWENKT